MMEILTVDNVCYTRLYEKEKYHYYKINNPMLKSMVYCHVILDFKQTRTDVSEFIFKELNIC